MRQDSGHVQELTVQFNNSEAQATQAKQNYELYSQKRDEACKSKTPWMSRS